MYNSLVLMREDGRLPEASVDDGSTAELSGFIQLVQHLDGSLPINTGISDTNTVLESRGAIFGNVLPASVDVGFDHDTGDRAVTSNKLLTDGVEDLRLVVVVLERVSVRAIDHDTRLVLRTGLLERSGGTLDVHSIVVGALGTASEDNVDIFVAAGLDDGGKTLLGNTHEGVGVGGRLHSIDCNTDTSIGSILEANWEGDTGSELTVELRLGRTSTNGSPRNEISDVLGRDGVEELGSHWDTKASEIAQELAGKAEALVDLEGAVEVRVIDETLPSDSRAWFFEVGPHDNEEVSPFRNLGLEELGVGDSLLRRVD